MMIDERLQNLISMTEKTCIKWLQKSTTGHMEFVDPIDRMEISAHYGTSHMAAALLLRRNMDLGNELLTSLLDRWDVNALLPGFHSDFNNFALCIMYDLAAESLKVKIKEKILHTPDSNHDTVNWLPMRWAVNRARFSWTQNQKYSEICEQCKEKIANATWSDGFIDDRLPLGLSFNLQYDVATVAVMQYLRVKGESIDLTKELGALLAAEAPDGDINYLGRGTNQIFAWGLWIYLLASSGQDAPLERAIAYLERHLPVALKNNNLMLNDVAGEEKYLWWDYHYCSVYTAHLLMWLILAQQHLAKAPINPKDFCAGNSGVNIYRNDTFFVVSFDGRKEYLAEHGPILCALWTKTCGMLVKGAFGPWMGAFGRKYIEYDVTLRNYVGFFRVSSNPDFSKSRIANKLNLNGIISYCEKIKPCFFEMEIQLKENSIVIMYKVPEQQKGEMFFNLPLINYNMKACPINLVINNTSCRMMSKQMFKNQYGWCLLYQAKIKDARFVKLVIER